jgi:DNA-binding HxlR family transcriptional regulator
MDIIVYMLNREAIMRTNANARMKSCEKGGCPVHAFQALVSGKYKLRIIWDLRDGAIRYNAIRRGLLKGMEGSAEIAPRVLSRELKSLIALGLLERIDYRQLPLRVEYCLTKTGHSLVPLIEAVHDWSVKHWLSRPM